MSIVVFGSLNADTTLDVGRQPEWGETILASDSSTAAGGKGANQAVAARRLGAEVLMVGRVGRDSAGEFLRSCLASDGVRDGLIEDPGQATGGAFILRAPDGRNSIVVAPGANRNVTVADLERTRPEPPVVLVLQLEVPLEVSFAAARLGRRRGWHVLLNPAPATPIDMATLAAIDTLVANEHEAAQLTGIAVGDADSACAAAEWLVSAGCGAVAVTLGEQGAVLVSRRGAWRATAPHVQAVDATAAGDAFVGALAVSILKSLEPPDALRLAVATGTLAVTRRGAQPSLPARSEAVDLAATVQVMEVAVGYTSGHLATAQTISVNTGVGGGGSAPVDVAKR